MNSFCGIDWAEGHHDIAIVDGEGKLVAKKRISDDSAGFTVLTEMLAAAGDSFDDAIPIAIETPRGLLVAALRATGRPVFANACGEHDRAANEGLSKELFPCRHAASSLFRGDSGDHWNRARLRHRYSRW